MNEYNIDYRLFTVQYIYRFPYSWAFRHLSRPHYLFGKISITGYKIYFSLQGEEFVSVGIKYLNVVYIFRK